MRSRLLVLLIISALIISSSPAFGRVRKFNRFSADIPDGWSVQLKGEEVNIIKDDNSAGLSVLVSASRGMTPREAANAIYENIKQNTHKNNFRDITRPKFDKEAGYYTFTMKNIYGANFVSFVTADKRFFYLVIVGIVKGCENQETTGEIMHIIKSIRDL